MRKIGAAVELPPRRPTTSSHWILSWVLIRFFRFPESFPRSDGNSTRLQVFPRPLGAWEGLGRPRQGVGGPCRARMHTGIQERQHASTHLSLADVLMVDPP